MKLKSISLTNFRGFEQLEINFHERVNVIAGVNGVGKSSVLQALRVMFSHALPNLTVGKGSVVRLTDDDIFEGQPSLEIGAAFEIHDEPARITMQRVLPNEARRAEWEERLNQIDREIDSAQQVKIPALVRRLREEKKTIEFNLSDDRDVFQLLLEQVETDRQRTGGLDDVQRQTQAMLRSFREQANQPLFLYYAPLRSVSGRVLSLPSGDPLGVARAYAGAMDEREASFQDFLHWYRWLEHDDNKATKRQRNALLKTLRSAVTGFIPEFSELKLEEQPKLRFMVNKAGQWLNLGQLSDGERGLLGLVFDLARRLALANPDLTDPLSKGEGMVMIDEVELHLHPSWQRRVLERLTVTFPACQFIVTSHSPQVIGEVANDSVRFLEKEGADGVMCWIPDQAIGLDANMILDLMGADSINQDIRAEIQAASRLANQRRFSEAQALLDEIKKKINGTNSGIIRVEAAIKFLGVK
jgi:predicted ATP-binding protein involved in virulence